jgi:chorismate-pyruvate lyase
VTTESRLKAALNGTSGTVTRFLEELVGERIAAERCHHQRIAAPASNDLGVDEGEPLLRRAAVLHGLASGHPFVYAESLIVLGRVPPIFLRGLETGSDPIGRLLDEAGIAVTRQDLGQVQGGAMDRPRNFDEVVHSSLLARSYRIESEHLPLMLISEWFLSALTPFLLDGVVR